jgi:RNA polymerase sigma-54 factor
MVLLQPRLNLKVSQKQILTPGLVQMVSVLALNKIELKDMINAEMVENPVLEELDGTVPLLDEVAGKEAERERAPVEADAVPADKKDPFEEIDFGSFFQDYLDPGYRSPEGEMVEKPSFENFLSEPTTLTDHLMWQLGAMNVKPGVHAAAELIIGNLNEEGYLLASDEELMAAADPSFRVPQPVKAVPDLPANGNGRLAPEVMDEVRELIGDGASSAAAADALEASMESELAAEAAEAESSLVATAVEEPPAAPLEPIASSSVASANAVFCLDELHEAIAMVRQMDPVGVAARDLRECLLSQLEYLAHEEEEQNGAVEPVLADALVIVDRYLRLLQTKQIKEIAKAMGRSAEAVQTAWDLIKTLDPRPGLRYNKVEPRLIEPDVAYIKHGDEYIVVLNDDDVPQLRLQQLQEADAPGRGGKRCSQLRQREI